MAKINSRAADQQRQALARALGTVAVQRFISGRVLPARANPRLAVRLVEEAGRYMQRRGHDVRRAAAV